MLVEFEYRDDLCILRLKGRFVTGADVGYLRSKAEEVKASGCRKVLADFRQVPYVDSTGIAFVVGLYTSITRSVGGRFVLIAPSPRVREVLDLTRLSTVIPIYADEASGLAALRESATATTADRK
ncbi:MAG TPA: STAS domain-containing protein [Bryobacteraceae bacterium]|nr:STAS domain-containing protein [Bryobacteraceae bacterium]